MTGFAAHITTQQWRRSSGVARTHNYARRRQIYRLHFAYCKKIF